MVNAEMLSSPSAHFIDAAGRDANGTFLIDNCQLVMVNAEMLSSPSAHFIDVEKLTVPRFKFILKTPNWLGLRIYYRKRSHEKSISL
jgi:hypothetical protein